MATVTLYQPQDMFSPYTWSGSLIGFSPVQLSISDGYRTAAYYGSFATAQSSITGTVTGYDYWIGGTLNLGIRGANADFATVNGLAAGSGADAVFDYILRGADLLVGSSAGDGLKGYGGDDILRGNGGNDGIDGGTGRDTAVFAGSLAGYTVTRDKDITQVSHNAGSGSDGADALINVEKLQFADMSINLTVDESAGRISPANLKLLEELYVAFFNRIPDADGLEYWTGQLHGGMTVNQIADLFYAAGVQYSALTGYSASMSNEDFVNVVYRNVLGRSQGADAEGLAYWSERLDSGVESKGSLVQSILGSAHTFKGNATWGWVADLLDNKAYVAHEFAVDMGLNYLNAQESISRGMQIAAAVTPTDTDAAIALIGINPANIDL